MRKNVYYGILTVFKKAVMSFLFFKLALSTRFLIN
jgi:hypothetical protein